jgi:hypothetical protein
MFPMPKVLKACCKYLPLSIMSAVPNCYHLASWLLASSQIPNTRLDDRSCGPKILLPWSNVTNIRHSYPMASRLFQTPARKSYVFLCFQRTHTGCHVRLASKLAMTTFLRLATRMPLVGVARNYNMISWLLAVLCSTNSHFPYRQGICFRNPHLSDAMLRLYGTAP